MILERLYPKTLGELESMVAPRCADATSVTVQAGHFLVYYDRTEDQLLPCVESELLGPRHEVIRKEVGHFPLLTWEIGVRLLASLPAPKKHLMVLVNDWQYLPDGIDRSRFYEAHKTLPASYTSILETEEDSIELLTPHQYGKSMFTGDFFGEQSLRNQYGKHVKQLIAQGKLPDNAELDMNGDTLSCSLVDVVGHKQEIYCAGKGQNCTHEVAELLHTVASITQCSVFINLFPLVCKQYVEAGTELGFDLFNTPVATVINIGMPATGVLSLEQLCASSAITLQEPSTSFKVEVNT